SAAPAGVKRIMRALPLLRSATNSAKRGSTEAGVSAAKLPVAGRLTPVSSAPKAKPAVGIDASNSAPTATFAAARLRLLVANFFTMKFSDLPLFSPHGTIPEIGLTVPDIRPD